MVVNFRLISKLLGPGILGLGLVAMIPSAYAGITGTDGFVVFGATALFAFALGFLLLSQGLNVGIKKISVRELFIFTTSLWVLAALIGSFPIYMICSDLDVPAAIFESTSALSTTGATVLTDIDGRPRSVLLWRSILQWIGGIGFILVAIAILPNVALGGMNIFKTESTSFDNFQKFTPRIKVLAFSIIGWYLLLTAVCAILYMIGGMGFFMGVSSAMTTISTGGMMATDSQFNDMSLFVQYTAILFMFISACSFLLTFRAAIKGEWGMLFRDQQIRGWFYAFVIISAIVAASLMLQNGYETERAIRVAMFNVATVVSTCGYALDDFSAWNNFTYLLFFILLPIGACSGSSSGGLKIFRLQICLSMFFTQVKKSVHPHIVASPTFNGRTIESDTLRSIVTIISAYMIALIVFSLLAVLLGGININDAFSGTITCLSNVGPAIGPNLGPSGSFFGLDSSVHLLWSCCMILGRLEILPVLLIFTRTFWK